MKKVIIVTFLSVISLYLSAQNVQFIAVHMGNPENLEALDKTPFPNFEFYYSDAELIRYQEEQKLVGMPVNLIGWYGEVPEKMGFCANYTVEKGKGYSGSYKQGAVFVVDENNIVAYQIQGDKINRTEVDVVYPAVQSSIASTVKKCKKGKLTKPLKESKQIYIKKSPIGEIEKAKGAKILKDGTGITGWNLPELTVKNESGEEMQLGSLTEGKTTVLVFFTLNGVNYKKGDTDGLIVNEWSGQKLISPKAYAENVESKVMDADVDSKGEAAKNMAKVMFKEAVGAGNSSLLKAVVLDGQEIDDRNKVEHYKINTQHLTMIEEISAKLKK